MKIITWNSRGNRTDLYLEMTQIADVVCLQESGLIAIPESAEQVVDGLFKWTGENTDQETVTLFAYPVDAGSVRCSQAILVSNTHYDCPRCHVFQKTGSDALGNPYRPLIGVEVVKKDTGETCWVFSAHLPASGNAKRVGAEYFNYLKDSFTRTVCAGDFNNDPGNWDASFAGRFAAPGDHTHWNSGTETYDTTLDYLYSVDMATGSAAVNTVYDGISDHRAVSFSVDL